MALESTPMNIENAASSKAESSEAGRIPSELFSYLGIVVMMVLIGVIVGVGIFGMKNIQITGEEIVQDRIEKTRLVQTMGVASRERTVLLQRMIMIDDPFERDALALEYNVMGSRFANARIELMKKDLSPEEKNILERQGQIAGKVIPIQNDVVDLVAADTITNARERLIHEALPLQDRILASLSELMTYQTTAAYDAITRTREEYERGRKITIAMFAIAAGISILLVWLVSKAARQRRGYFEQTQAANRAKSSFLAKMSHEIRTPLTTIIGFAELSLDGEQSAEDRMKALRTIHGSGKHLLQIINDILDLSKIEADKFSIEKETCSLFQLLQDASTLVQMQATGKGLVFGVNYKFPLPRTIETDPLRLKQVIINLCGNSIKFTEKGSVYINVSYERSTEHLMIEVEDSGIGMTPEESSRLFQEFQQADAGINRKYGGTGLGLAVSQKLAALLGGYIVVKSEKGIGSKFTLILKQPEVTDQLVYGAREIEINSTRKRDLATHAGKVQGTVLLAEDTPQIRDLLVLFLRRAGVTVTAVENGAEALMALARAKFDLVLMDIQMPVMDGLTAMRKLSAEKCPVPVVALTANAMKDDQEIYRKAGFASFLAKPVEHDRLVAVLEKYLAASAGEEDAPIFGTLGDGDPEMQQLIDAFVAKLPDYVGPLEQAARDEHWDRVHEIAHKLKGLGGGMGYPVISDIAASIMFQVKAGNFAEAVQQVSRMVKSAARVRPVGAPATPETI